MWFKDLVQDLHYALRLISRSRGFSAVIVLTLALGIGANTAVFSIIDGALLRPLPYKAPEQLVDVLDASRREQGMSKLFESYADYDEFRKHARSLQQVGAATWAVAGSTLTGLGPAHTVLAIPVSENFFDVLGVNAARGRTFAPTDLSHGCSIVLSNAFWLDSLGANPNVVGTAITLNNRPCTVIGVMPGTFEFYPRQTQLWTLLTPDLIPSPEKLPLIPFARLKPGVNRGQAQAELIALHTALHRKDPLERELRPSVSNLQDQFTWLAGRNLRTTLWALLAAVGLVLLIASVNVANLLLGRSYRRAREFAIRTALGSGQNRLVRQVLAESLLLSILGGGLGVCGAFGAVGAFRAVSAIELPVGAEITVNTSVLLLSVLLSCFAALLFGTLPAWRASRYDANDGLKGSSGGTASCRSLVTVKALITLEMALSLVLLTGSGLLLESVLKMAVTPLGFNPDNLIIAKTQLPAEEYPDAARRLQFYDELHRRLSAIPGVAAVSFNSSPTPNRSGNQAIQIEGRTIPGAYLAHDVGTSAVTPDYLRVREVALLRGRFFDNRDRTNSEPVAVINEAAAAEYFPNLEALGQRIRIGEQSKGQWLTIIGIVDTEKRTTVYSEMSWVEAPHVYQPLAQNVGAFVTIEVRAAADQSAIGHEIQGAITALDSRIAADAPETMRHQMGQFLQYPRFRAIVFGMFAAAALLLAGVGLYGMLAQFVAQRTQEIGLRIAIGAQRRDIVQFISSQGGVPIVTGLSIGIVATLWLGQYLTTLLYEVHPSDPVIFMAGSFTLVIAAGLGAAAPLWRAVRLDPMVALRND